MRGPAVMLSQFMGDGPPFDSLEGVVGWLAGLGYVGVQVPVHDARLIDLDRAASDDGYCRDYKARLAGLGVEITELAAHRAGQLTAVNPAFSEMADVFADPSVRGNPAARAAWAAARMRLAIEAAARLGLQRVGTFTGAFVWPYFYPWPPAPPGVVDAAFEELAHDLVA